MPYIGSDTSLLRRLVHDQGDERQQVLWVDFTSEFFPDVWRVSLRDHGHFSRSIREVRCVFSTSPGAGEDRAFMYQAFCRLVAFQARRGIPLYYLPLDRSGAENDTDLGFFVNFRPRFEESLPGVYRYQVRVHDFSSSTVKSSYLKNVARECFRRASRTKIAGDDDFARLYRWIEDPEGNFTGQCDEVEEDFSGRLSGRAPELDSPGFLKRYHWCKGGRFQELVASLSNIPACGDLEARHRVFPGPSGWFESVIEELASLKPRILEFYASDPDSPPRLRFPDPGLLPPESFTEFLHQVAGDVADARPEGDSPPLISVLRPCLNALFRIETCDGLGTVLDLMAAIQGGLRSAPSGASRTTRYGMSRDLLRNVRLFVNEWTGLIDNEISMLRERPQTVFMESGANTFYNAHVTLFRLFNEFFLGGAIAFCWGQRPVVNWLPASISHFFASSSGLNGLLAQAFYKMYELLDMYWFLYVSCQLISDEKGLIDGEVSKVFELARLTYLQQQNLLKELNLQPRLRAGREADGDPDLYEEIDRPLEEPSRIEEHALRAADGDIDELVKRVIELFRLGGGDADVEGSSDHARLWVPRYFNNNEAFGVAWEMFSRLDEDGVFCEHLDLEGLPDALSFYQRATVVESFCACDEFVELKRQALDQTLEAFEDDPLRPRWFTAVPEVFVNKLDGFMDAAREHRFFIAGDDGRWALSTRNYNWAPDEVRLLFFQKLKGLNEAQFYSRMAPGVWDSLVGWSGWALRELELEGLRERHFELVSRGNNRRTAHEKLFSLLARLSMTYPDISHPYWGDLEAQPTAFRLVNTYDTDLMMFFSADDPDDFEQRWFQPSYLRRLLERDAVLLEELLLVFDNFRIQGRLEKDVFGVYA